MRLRTFALAGIAAVLPSLAAAQTAQVGASKLLTATPQAFLETCRADIEQARASAAQFRTADGGDWAAALDRYDTAVGLLADAASRASLARNVHPDEADAQRRVRLRERRGQGGHRAVARPRRCTTR